MSNMAKKKTFNGLSSYLNHYYTYYQKDIVLVYRGDETGDWAKRCLYLSDKYHPLVKYNHRWILEDEIVIEFDNEDPELNAKLANRVMYRLRDDNIKYAKWFSGGKSTHIHFILRKYNVSNKVLLKKAIMEHYGTYYYDPNTKRLFDEDAEGRIKLSCDLRLAGANHLIRAEYGIHEKTQDKKRLMSKSDDYPCRSPIKIEIFEKYTDSIRRSNATRIGQNTANLSEHDLVKKLMDSVQFKEGMNDGRERILFALSNILIKKYDGKEEELIDLLWDWYKYASTQPCKLSKGHVATKVRNAKRKPYTITINTLKGYIDEVGGTI